MVEDWLWIVSTTVVPHLSVLEIHLLCKFSALLAHFPFVERVRVLDVYCNYFLYLAQVQEQAALYVCSARSFDILLR
jgi:hypothetical protein